MKGESGLGPEGPVEIDARPVGGAVDTVDIHAASAVGHDLLGFEPVVEGSFADRVVREARIARAEEAPLAGWAAVGVAMVFVVVFGLPT